MTLPLATPDRSEMHGDRYRGFIGSIVADVEHGDLWWMHGMEFQAATRPPFQWAGQQRQEMTA
jgi:hypothetical protein